MSHYDPAPVGNYSVYLSVATTMFRVPNFFIIIRTNRCCLDKLSLFNDDRIDPRIAAKITINRTTETEWSGAEFNSPVSRWLTRLSRWFRKTGTLDLGRSSLSLWRNWCQRHVKQITSPPLVPSAPTPFWRVASTWRASVWGNLPAVCSWCVTV